MKFLSAINQCLRDKRFSWRHNVPPCCRSVGFMTRNGTVQSCSRSARRRTASVVPSITRLKGTTRICEFPDHLNSLCVLSMNHLFAQRCVVNRVREIYFSVLSTAFMHRSAYKFLFVSCFVCLLTLELPIVNTKLFLPKPVKMIGLIKMFYYYICFNLLISYFLTEGISCYIVHFWYY